MEACSGEKTDLDLLIDDFQAWQKITADLYCDNKDLRTQLYYLQKQCQLYKESEKLFTTNNAELRETIDTLQSILLKRCDLENENSRLREQLNLLHLEIDHLEKQHRQQMTEAMENLQAIQQAHKKDLIQVHESVNYQMRKEIDSLQKTVQDKAGEIQQLQKQLAEVERDKHTEIVKLRLEYDAKLLKLQKQNTRSQAQPSTSSMNSDIFRRKLQAAKADYEREISSLRRRVAELEKQVQTSTKRRKI